MIPDNNAAEMRAFEATCRRLHGFDARLNAEFIDGYLCALAAGPRSLPAAEWLPSLGGETFGRVFADPQDQARALAALQARLSVLRGQLDPEALIDEPDRLRLDPWLSEWTDEERQRVSDEAQLSAADAALLQTGVIWAEGFFQAIEQLPQLWALPEDDPPAQLFADALDQLTLLMTPPGSDEWRAAMQQHYPDAETEPSRDDLIAEACMAVQDLRLLWVDFAPKPLTRRVEATPGRNDACPCGSGKKFKRCHGADQA